MLFSKKSVESLISEAEKGQELKRSLSAVGLIALGIGAIIGAGLFSITGVAAAHYAGPGIILSFIIAAIGCAFAGLCYAEFASMIPIAGSAYTYSYATMGEFIAWIIGWDLVLEYSVTAATVASSWGGYLNEFLKSFGFSLPFSLLKTPFESYTLPDGTVETGIINLPALFIVVIISMFLIRGIRESSKLNNLIVFLKVGIILLFIVVGMKYVDAKNLTPFVPKNETGEFGNFGWTGIVRAAAIVFFAYIGFDAVSTAAQETKKPKKAMPIGILGALLICTALYIAFAYVMLGVANYTEFGKGDNDLAPVATAINHMGHMDASGNIVPAYPWLNRTIIIAILLGYSSVILVMLMGQSRVFYSMSKDGLLPSFFSSLHKKFATPAKTNLLFMVFVSLFAAFVPGKVVGEMASIGTLFAFILVCIGVIVMRKVNPEVPRPFKTPLVPLVPVLGVITCMGMMAFLPLDTWIRLVLWMIIGFDIYLLYGIKKSHLSVNDTYLNRSQSYYVTSVVGIVLCILLGILAYAHHHLGDGDDKGLVYSSVVLTVVHLLFYIYYLVYSVRIKKAKL